MEEKHISLLHLKFMSEIVSLILNLYFFIFLYSDAKELAHGFDPLNPRLAWLKCNFSIEYSYAIQ